MKHVIIFFLRSLFSLLLMIQLVSCRSQREENAQCTRQLIRLDSLLNTHPADVSDSLARLIPAEMTDANRTYYYLLKSIAEAKMETPEQNDSLLNLAYRYYSKKNAPGEQARCLLYKGVIRYASNPKDSIAFLLLKKAERMMDSSLLDMPETRIVLYAHLGRIHRIHKNHLLAEKYIRKTYELSHRLNDPDKLVTSLIEWYWISTSVNNPQAATSAFLKLTALDSIPAELQSYVDVIKVNATQSNLLRQQVVETLKKMGNAPLSPGVSHTARIFQIAKYYHQLNLPDSSMHYLEQGLLSLKQDSTTLQKATHLHLAADLFAETGAYLKAITLYKEAYIASEQDQNIISMQRIAELEKKYDQAVTQQELHREKQKNRLIIYIILALSLVITLIAYMAWQHLKTKQKLIQEEATEHQKWLDFFEYSFYSLTQVLPGFIRQIDKISLRGKRKQGVEIYEDLQQAIENVKKNNKEAFTKISQHPSFNNLYPSEKMSTLSDREKIIHILLEKGFSSSKIAGLIGCTGSSIRASKTKIKSKINIP